MNGKLTLLSQDNKLSAELNNILPDNLDFNTTSETENIPDSDVVFLDIDSVGMGGLGILKNKSFVIVVTFEKGTRYLIESMTFGAFDCIFRPLDSAKLLQAVNRAIGIKSELTEKLVEFPGDIEGSSVTCAIVGNSPQLQEVCKVIGQVGRVDVPVLITGESGTGKDLVAESIWKVSTRWEKPFVVINCAAIPETLLEAELFGYEKGAFTGATSSRVGKFEEADGGVIFLDEIGDMSFSLQAKVLRVIQNGNFQRLGSNDQIDVDVRLITATNKDLEELVREQRFREDLYFRINVINIDLPPLRDRKEDIPLLVQCFIRRYSAQIGKKVRGATDRFFDKLMDYEWPGNIRELENTVKKAIAFTKANYLTSFDLEELENPLRVPEIKQPSSFKDPLRDSVRGLLDSKGTNGTVHSRVMKQAEKILVEEALTASGWNRSKAARMLGINRLTLRRKVEEYNITFPKSIESIES